MKKVFLTLLIISSTLFVACKKCKECRECHTAIDAVSGNDSACGPYISYCDEELKAVENDGCKCFTCK